MCNVILHIGTAADRHLQRIYCRLANGVSSQRSAERHAGRSKADLWGM